MKKMIQEGTHKMKKSKLKKLIRKVKQIFNEREIIPDQKKYWVCSKCKNIELQRPGSIVCKSCGEGYMEKREKL